jgi:hypothetical protein
MKSTIPSAKLHICGGGARSNERTKQSKKLDVDQEGNKK